MKSCFHILPMMAILAFPWTVSAVIYGKDDFVDIDQIAEITEPNGVDWAMLARSVAVIMTESDIGPEGGLDLTDAPTMFDEDSSDFPLLPDCEYGNQVELSSEGTAFLVATDKMMTAGHMGKDDLLDMVFLFDYTWDTDTESLHKTYYGDDEIYRCVEVLLHRDDEGGDYAICQLDKPVYDRDPLQLLPVESADELHMRPAKMISSPEGIPLKLTNQGRIFTRSEYLNNATLMDLNTDAFFYHNLDNSGGSSGAPIFDEHTGEVVGIQSGGDDNYYDTTNHTVPVRGNLRSSNIGRGLEGESGSLIPEEALEIIGDLRR